MRDNSHAFAAPLCPHSPACHLRQHRGRTDRHSMLSQLETWIEMLDSPKYRDRAEATAKLQRSGGSAIEAVERIVIAWQQRSIRSSTRILEEHYNNDDEILKEVSAEALQRIAEQTEHGKSKAAQRILEPAEPKPSNNPIPEPASPESGSSQPSNQDSNLRQQRRERHHRRRER